MTAIFSTLTLICLFGAVSEKLSYQHTTIALLSSGKVSRTRAEVTGNVSLVKHEADGDLHVRLTDGNSFIVAECMPKLPCNPPKLGSVITVGGITRFDAEHKWWEIHPVEYIK